MCVGVFVTAYNPAGKITINGIPTYDFHKKLMVAAFSLVFPVVGALLSLTSRKTLEALLRPAVDQAAELTSRFGLKK